MDTLDDEIDELGALMDEVFQISDSYRGSSNWKPLPKTEEAKKKETPDRSKDPTFGSW